MVLEVVDISLVQFKDREFEEEMVSAKMMKAVDDKDLYVPVVIRVGAVDYKIGAMIRVRRGREEIFGDLTLDIVGSLEWEVIRSESGEIIEVKPKKWVYVKE